MIGQLICLSNNCMFMRTNFKFIPHSAILRECSLLTSQSARAFSSPFIDIFIYIFQRYLYILARHPSCRILILTLLQHTERENLSQLLKVSETPQFPGCCSQCFQLLASLGQRIWQTVTASTQTRQIKGDNPESILR